MRKSILIMLLAVVSSSAWAEWVEVSRNDTSTIYANPATIRKAGDIVKMWYLIDYRIIQGANVGSPFLSSKDQSEYDCKEERTRTLYFTNHSGNMGGGDNNYSSETPLNWRPISPGSVGESLWQFACGKR